MRLSVKAASLSTFLQQKGSKALFFVVIVLIVITITITITNAATTPSANASKVQPAIRQIPARSYYGIDGIAHTRAVDFVLVTVINTDTRTYPSTTFGGAGCPKYGKTAQNARGLRG